MNCKKCGYNFYSSNITYSIGEDIICPICFERNNLKSKNILTFKKSKIGNSTKGVSDMYSCSNNFILK